jgi:serine/threonine protein kinase
LRTHLFAGTSDGLCYRLVFPAPRIAPLRPDLSHSTAKNWEIARTELELRSRLGTGNFGEVWYGMWRGVVEVAVKTIKAGAMSKKAFLDEAEIMKKCYHPNLGI